MQKIRITIRHNPNDPAEDLQYAARMRADLWAHSPVEIDPDNCVHGTHRDSDKNAYFELVTDMVPEVERVIEKQNISDRAIISIIEENLGEPCQNCGNIVGPVLPTICPTCNHRDIEPCPACCKEVPRQNYDKISGNLFRCHERVRLNLNPDLWKADRTLNEPIVIVEKAAG